MHHYFGVDKSAFLSAVNKSSEADLHSLLR
jgi:hypothetical protein